MLSAVITLSGIGLISGVGLGIAYKKFAVHFDPKVEEISTALPGANCGGCGYAGCQGLAQAIFKGEAEINACVAGGEAVAQAIAKIMGVESSASVRRVARVMCRGGKKEKIPKFEYAGILNCKAATIVAGGDKACIYGCLGLGTCMDTCPFGAIRIGDDNLPEINEAMCKGCGKCIAACPKQIIMLVPETAKTIVFCNSKDKGPKVKKVCKVGCIGCGVCKKVCPQEAIVLENNLARIDYSKCNACGKCTEKCPTKAIQVIQP